MKLWVIVAGPTHSSGDNDTAMSAPALGVDHCYARSLGELFRPLSIVRAPEPFGLASVPEPGGQSQSIRELSASPCDIYPPPV